ncbi:hypothetical protein DV515_00004351 [Chloebia gouldiae]|uniref:Uncharacterized protein n=1 Tax=Chloebia gouldiae TaxID=44316 RepID=A0A3L8SQN0_CHLGU|nr:hypothetical protein DV515_00004351 [Chloebia gouldiae]
MSQNVKVHEKELLCDQNLIMTTLDNVKAPIYGGPKDNPSILRTIVLYNHLQLEGNRKITSDVCESGKGLTGVQSPLKQLVLVVLQLHAHSGSPPWLATAPNNQGTKPGEQAGSLCGVFAVVLLVPEVLHAIVLELRTSSACKARLFCRAEQGLEAQAQRSWKELGGELMFGCIIRLFIPHLRTGSSEQGYELLFVAGQVAAAGTLRVPSAGRWQLPRRAPCPRAEQRVQLGEQRCQGLGGRERYTGTETRDIYNSIKRTEQRKRLRDGPTIRSEVSGAVGKSAQVLCKCVPPPVLFASAPLFQSQQRCYGNSVIYPDVMKSPINQHFAVVIITHAIWVWNADALTSRMEEMFNTQVLEQLIAVSYMAELYSVNFFEKDELRINTLCLRIVTYTAEYNGKLANSLPKSISAEESTEFINLEMYIANPMLCQKKPPGLPFGITTPNHQGIWAKRVQVARGSGPLAVLPKPLLMRHHLVLSRQATYGYRKIRFMFMGIDKLESFNGFQRCYAGPVKGILFQDKQYVDAVMAFVRLTVFQLPTIYQTDTDKDHIIWPCLNFCRISGHRKAELKAFTQEGTDSILAPHFHCHERHCAAQTVCDTLLPVMLVVGTLHCTVMSRVSHQCLSSCKFILNGITRNYAATVKKIFRHPGDQKKSTEERAKH